MERRQPKWQRARFITKSDYPGCECWLRMDAPYVASGTGISCGSSWRGRCYVINIVLGSQSAKANAAHVELLARSPADFADEVRMVTYEQWLAGDDGTILQTAGDATARH